VLGASPAKIANGYRALARMNESGLPLDASLETLKTALGGDDQQRLQRIAQRVRKGTFLHRAMEIEEISAIDVALIKVGEKTGTLSETAKFLMQFYEERAALERSVRRALIRPFLMFLSSLFLRDLPSVFGGLITPFNYFTRTFGILGAILGLTAALVYSYRLSYRSRAVAEKWQKLLRRIPWFGAGMRALNKERFFTCLRLGMKSGCDLPTMIDIAKDMSTLAEVRGQAEKIAHHIQRVGLAKAFAQSGMCSGDELLLLHSGESAGQIEESLTKICQDLRADLEHRLKVFEEWLPKIIYVAAMIYVASGIISSVKSQYKMLEQKIDMQ